MAARAWGHRERLMVFGGFGALLMVCGAVAAAVGAPDGPEVALVGATLGCWEALGLWLASAYRRRPPK